MSVDAASSSSHASGAADKASSSPLASTALSRLQVFYAFYAPTLVPAAHATLAAYAGREAELFHALEKKYGPEEAAVSNLRRTAEVADAVKGGRVRFAHDEATAEVASPRRCDALHNVESVQQLPSVPPPEPSGLAIHFNGFRCRLERFYRLYAPDKLSNIDNALASYQGREQIMLRLLENKYGPEPRAFTVVEALPRGSGNADGGGNEDWERAVRHQQATVTLATAGPDPDALAQHVPYNYTKALQGVGVRKEFVSHLLSMYGEGKEPYAASLVLLISLITPDTVFESDPDAKLVFPAASLRLAKPDGALDLVDLLAFEHLLTFRSLFASAVQHGEYVRSLESVHRQRIWTQFSSESAAIAYRCAVVREALLHLPEIESERRSVVTSDEQVRFDGIVLWFRRRRVEVLRGGAREEFSGPLVPSETPADQARGPHSSPPHGFADDRSHPVDVAASETSARQLAEAQRQESSARVQLSVLEEKMKAVHESLRTRTVTLIESWTNPTNATSSVSNSCAVSQPATARRTVSSGRGESEAHGQLHPTGPSARRSSSADRSGEREGGGGAGRERSSSLKESRRSWNRGGSAHNSTITDKSSASPQHTSRSARSGRSVSNNGTVTRPSAVPAVAWHPGGVLDHHRIMERRMLAESAGAQPVVVREHLKYDPFGRVDAAADKERNPFVLGDTARASSSASTAASNNNTATGSTNTAPAVSLSLALAPNAAPYALEKVVRLKSLAPKGIFSRLLHCTAVSEMQASRKE